MGRDTRPVTSELELAPATLGEAHGLVLNDRAVGRQGVRPRRGRVAPRRVVRLGGTRVGLEQSVDVLDQKTALGVEPICQEQSRQIRPATTQRHGTCALVERDEAGDDDDLVAIERGFDAGRVHRHGVGIEGRTGCGECELAGACDPVGDAGALQLGPEQRGAVALAAGQQ